MLRALLLLWLLLACVPKPAAPVAPLDPGVAATIERLLLEEQWDRAELLLQGALLHDPDDLRALVQWDIVLHGQGRFTEAERTRTRLLEVWTRDVAPAWRARGAPTQEASWVRVLRRTKRYRIVGSEYYEPPVRGKAPRQSRVIYEVLAIPFDGVGGPRRFEVHELRPKKRLEWELRRNLGVDGLEAVLGYRTRPSIELVVTDATIELTTDERDREE